MRFPLIVGIIGGHLAGKASFSKVLQKHLLDKHKLSSYVLNSKNKPELATVKKEHDLEDIFESAMADVVMVSGVTMFQNEKLRAQIDFRIFLDSEADDRLAEFIAQARKGSDDDVDKIIEQYFTQVKPNYDQSLQWKDHAHFFADPNMPVDKLNLLGLMIKDMVEKHDALNDHVHVH